MMLVFSLWVLWLWIPLTGHGPLVIPASASPGDAQAIPLAA
jgi:hypothetical protein